MENQAIRILLMDDEPASPIIETALEFFKENGFEVDLTDTISKALDKYHEKYHDIFILDIDMSHTTDSKENDGIHVLKRFISLHNQTKVIMFSAAGQVPEWFAAANAHCYGYIAKDENQACRKLIDMISRAVKEPRKRISSMKKPESPSNCLVYTNRKEDMNNIKPLLEEVLGNNWKITVSTELDQTVKAMQSGTKWGLVMMIKDHFTTRKKEKDWLQALMTNEPFPHTIVCCNGEDKNRASILFIANLHPFRMIDLLDPDWKKSLKPAIKKAIQWYGRNEIFKADSEFLKRVKVKLPEEAREPWETFDTGELEKAYEELTYDSEQEDESDE